MAKRQSKLQQQEAEARKLNEERKARADKEAAERRAKQAEALEVSERVAVVCCLLSVASLIYYPCINIYNLIMYTTRVHLIIRS